MADKIEKGDLLVCTTEIVVSYVAHHVISMGEIPSLIQHVNRALMELNEPTTPSLKPAVPINKSVTDDYVVCLEDGKKLQMLKRYLKTAHGLTVEQYKEKWKLPLDYPIVAPNYTKRRSEIARTTGLGTKGRPRKIKTLEKNSPLPVAS